MRVVFALPEKQQCICFNVVDGTSVEQAIEQSGIGKQFPEIDLNTMPVGIFSKICQLDTRVEQDDRIEIYRPLRQHPMDARRNRAKM